MNEIWKLLPEEYASRIRAYVAVEPEEIRLAVGQPVLVRWGDQEVRLKPNVDAICMERIVRSACSQSVYAHQDTIRQGYLAVEGGHRIGLCGTGVLQEEAVQILTDISSLVIRIAREVIGCADGIGSISGSALIIGPPCSGKTTLLRDMVRNLSDRCEQRVSLVDERGEIAAVVHGQPQFCVGSRTDVMTGVPKEKGMMMMLRTMNPQWIAVDEITSPLDVQVMERISYCGVRLLATAHADDIQDLYKRPLYRKMMQCNLFRTIICLRTDKSYVMQEVEL